MRSPRGRKPSRGELPERHGHRRGEVQHVDGAPSPHLGPGRAVDELAAEGVAGPSFGVDGDDVGVAHQAQARRAGLAAFHAGDERDPARGRLEAGHVEAGVAEERVERVGVAMLEARAGRAVVDAAVADHRLQQLDGLSSDRGRCHTRSSSRRPSRRSPKPATADTSRHGSTLRRPSSCSSRSSARANRRGPVPSRSRS